MKSLLKTCLVLCLCLCFWAGAAVAAAGLAQRKPAQPRITQGVLDLSQWELAALGPLRLDGEWQFFWGRLLNPAADAAQTGPKPGYIKVPGSWNGRLLAGRELGGFGRASYRLVIKLREPGQPVALVLGAIHSAFLLYVNGRLLAGQGSPETEGYIPLPAKHPVVLKLLPKEKQLVIVVQVANYHHRLGGVVKSITFGDQEEVLDHLAIRHNGEIFMMGIIFMMGLYHVGLYLARRKEKATIYFGVFLLIMLARVLSTGEVFLARMVPGLNWLWMARIEYWTFFLALPAFAWYLHNLFPRLFSIMVLVALQALGGLFSLFVLFSPLHLSSAAIPCYQVITLVAGAYIIYVLLAAVVKKREQAWLFLAGFLALFITAVNDILHAAEIINTTYVIHFGIIAFIALQSYALSVRYARAFGAVENKSEELAATNLAYKSEIVERKRLQEDLLASTERIKGIRVATILGLAKLAEYRDHDTGAHLERMREYSRMLALGLSKNPKYAHYIDAEYVDDIYQSSILHDIGKVGVPDAVLLKPGRLTPEEFEIIKTHTGIGGDAITNVEEEVEGQSFLTLGRKIAYSHHEKFDGSGYPKGLMGDAIPLSARIVALADVYDALTSKRPYKEAMSHEAARKIILEGNGSHFDPDLVEVFLWLEEEFKRIRREMVDG